MFGTLRATLKKIMRDGIHEAFEKGIKKGQYDERQRWGKRLHEIVEEGDFTPPELEDALTIIADALLGNNFP